VIAEHHWLQFLAVNLDFRTCASLHMHTFGKIVPSFAINVMLQNDSFGGGLELKL